MWLLRSIWKDLLWLNARLPRIVKIGLVIVVIASVVFAIGLKLWWLGTGYWTERVTGRYMTVPRPRIEILGVLVGVILITCITYAIGRDRPRR